jgi:predicted nucleic acid-binding protein
LALLHRARLVTRNVADFTGIDGLEVINPWLPR